MNKLRTEVQAAAKRGYLIGLDGRHLHVRSEHAALNTLLQSAGALVAKQWLVEFFTKARHLKLTSGPDKDFALVGWCHDELQFQVKEELSDQIGDLLVEAALDAGKFFKFKVPIGAEYKVGKTWADTH